MNSCFNVVEEMVVHYGCFAVLYYGFLYSMTKEGTLMF